MAVLAPWLPAITALAAVSSAGAGIASAVSKPDVPKEPAAVPNRQALMADRARAAAAQGRSSTVVTGTKLGNVGNIG
jgi:hypothetical protein